MPRAAAIHDDSSPFHAGERRIQEALGVRMEMESWGRRVVHDHMPDEHAAFYTQLPFVVAAARDGRGRPWATLLAGGPGFIGVPDDTTLAIGAEPQADDALAGGFAPGTDVGLLGIELHTRRRNRVNGRVRGHHAGVIDFEVDQAFGNCPQYIHARQWQSGGAAPQRDVCERSDRLSGAQRSLIERADTFFIATGYRAERECAAYGMDASHRGGVPGFVTLEDDRMLVFPDYTGNNHFNTLGNLLLDPRAGLLFVDFERGSLLQLSGRAEVDWRDPDQQVHPGARRLVRFEVEEVVNQPGVLPIRWSTADSPARPLRVIHKVVESDDVTSFHLADASGEPLPGWQPGQHLPIELRREGSAPALGRTYSLSNAPASQTYRISVKREAHGHFSRLLHDEIGPGSVLHARRPSGDFVLDLEATSEDRAIVLVGAGIGITPLVSMLHAVAERRPNQRVVWVQGARDGAHHPLRDEVRRLIGALPRASGYVRYSRPAESDVVGVDHDEVGRVDADWIHTLSGADGGDFYLCGPAAFMGQVQTGLEALGVDPARIRFETF